MFFTLKSYAKLNLFLSVKGLDEDTGYHKISSLMTYVNLYDVISITTKQHGSGLSMSFSGKYAHKISKIVGNKIKDNLIAKAFAAIAKEYELSIDLDVNLEKNIPLASGMGGGSSNAAAIIDFCDCFYGLEMTQEDKLSIAKRLGCDVAFFTQKQAAICSNFGEVVDPVLLQKSIENHAVLLIDTGQKTSSHNIYKSYDSLKLNKEQESIVNCENDLSTLKLQTMTKLGIEADLFEEILSSKNDNHLVFANKNIMSFTKNILNFVCNISNENDILGFGITGAGATIYVIYKSANEARHAMTKFSSKFPMVYTNITNLMQNVEKESTIFQLGRYLLKCA